MNEAVKKIVQMAGSVSGVPVYHAPSPSAGEKIIYRCTPGKFDGDFEVFTVVMRFISRDLAQAMLRARRVSEALCRPGDSGIDADGERLYALREEGGGSGFIGKTGHFYVMTRYEVRKRGRADIGGVTPVM